MFRLEHPPAAADEHGLVELEGTVKPLEVERDDLRAVPPRRERVEVVAEDAEALGVDAQEGVLRARDDAVRMLSNVAEQTGLFDIEQRVDGRRCALCEGPRDRTTRAQPSRTKDDGELKARKATNLQRASRRPWPA
jgi:hypothetical protein